MRLAIAGGSDTLFARWRETDAGDASARDATSLIVGCFNGQSLRNRFPYEQKPVSDASPNFGTPSAKAESVSDFWVVLKLAAVAEWLQIGAERCQIAVRTKLAILSDLIGMWSARVSRSSPGRASHADAQELSLAGKKIGITAIGANHDWDLRAHQGQIDEIKRLGCPPLALDASRNDQTQVTQIQTLIAQKPDAIIEQLGNLPV
jgi:hypothetical protein